jgi:hypothetical protein
MRSRVTQFKQNKEASQRNAKFFKKLKRKKTKNRFKSPTTFKENRKQTDESNNNNKSFGALRRRQMIKTVSKVGEMISTDIPTNLTSNEDHD